jgi:anti-sigma-K factor RskA
MPPLDRLDRGRRPGRGARVVAYVLGEMTLQERCAFEAELTFDADLRDELETLRRVQRTLSRAAERR